MDITPILEKIWKALELRLLVLVSLSLQVVLIFSGNRRKYTKNKRVAALLWFCYLLADYVATFALGILSQAKCVESDFADQKKHTISVFWAPFLLIHLGGPDTITAYAMADNELWSRHVLGLISQLYVALYVYLGSFTPTSLNFLWLVIFFAGVIKYGERSWVLFSASKDRYRNSLISQPDPGPNYPKFVDEAISREEEGYKVILGSLFTNNTREESISLLNNTRISDSENPQARDDSASSSNTRNSDSESPQARDNNRSPSSGRISDSEVFAKANFFFGTFKKLFADLILSFQDREDSISYFENLKWEDAFKIVEIELGLVYDLFYTKSSFVFSRAGVILRVLTCSSTIAAFVAFLFIQEGYPQTEVIITYVLLLGAITLEMYAILLLVLSERMVIRLGRDLRKNILVSLLYRFRLVPAKEMWSKSVGQYNVLDHCLKYMPKRAAKLDRHPEMIDRFIASVKCHSVTFHQYLDRNFRWKSKPVEDRLKELIYEKMKKTLRKVDSNWIDNTLKDATCFDKEDEIEFDQSILIWHMATDICYHTTVVGDNNSKRENCVLLSNYMVHLLITSPFMLPSGIGQIRFQDTCAETTEFFDNHRGLSARVACKKLSEKEIKYRPSEVKGDRSKSVLFDACGLAAHLKNPENDEIWETVTQAWLDMLLFAAAQCSWSDHADKLNQGSELLTHVWLLMAHFGMTDQFQISKGHIRAKLVLN